MMRIGELAARSGVSVRSLRYYEEQGLLSSRRSAAGQRLYDDDAAGRVHFIQQLYAAGLSSRDVLDLLPCVYTGTTTPGMVERLVAERERIDRQARELVATRDRLDEVIAVAQARLAS